MQTMVWAAWSEDADAKLWELEGQGLSHADLAAALGRTKAAVAWRLSILRKRHATTPATNGVLPPVIEEAIEVEKPEPREDPEVTAIAAIAARLRELRSEQRGRVLRWLFDRYATEA